MLHLKACHSHHHNRCDTFDQFALCAPFCHISEYLFETLAIDLSPNLKLHLLNSYKLHLQLRVKAVEWSGRAKIALPSKSFQAIKEKKKQRAQAFSVGLRML
jgi:hypothetical protein